MALTGSEDIAVVIGILPCSSASACPDVTDILGDILYSGPYTASVVEGAWGPYENFTVTIPSWYSGPVQLGVAHFYLLGVCISIPLPGPAHMLMTFVIGGFQCRAAVCQHHTECRRVRLKTG